VHALVELDREYVASAPADRWEEVYSRGLMSRFALG
jgi:hypothetical protein